MSFISILKDIGRVFTGPVAQDIEKIALPVLGTVFPGIGPLLTGITDVVGAIQKGAAGVAAQPTNTEKLAAALKLGEQLFTDFETASGIKVPAGNQANIVSFIVSILNEIPTIPTTASTAPPAA